MKASSAVWVAALFAAGFAVGYGLRGSGGGAVRPEVRVITLRDTVTVAEPAPVAVRYLKPDTVRLAIVAPTDSAVQDSAYVELPRSQAVFEGESYRAYVSGYKPRLDSLALFRSTAAVSVVQPEARRERRFSVGLQAGYGITPKGLQPYIGLGISVTLARF